MDFGDILEEWERQRKILESGNRNSSEKKKKRRHGKRDSSVGEEGESVARRELLRWLDGVDDWEEGQRAKGEHRSSDPVSGKGSSNGHTQKSRSRLRKMAPDDTLDLHGMTSDDAERALRLFIERHGS